MPPQSPQRFSGIRGARVCRKEADLANPKPQSAKRWMHPMGLGAGSWSQASCTARLPPPGWRPLLSPSIRSDAPQRRRQKACPRVRATMRRLMRSANACGQVGSRWRVCSSVLVRDGAGFGGSEAQELLPMAAIADSLPPLIRPCPASRGGCPSSLSHRLLVGLQVLAGHPLLAHRKGTGTLELPGPLQGGRLCGEHGVGLGRKPRCRRHAQDEGRDQEWCDPARTRECQGCDCGDGDMETMEGSDEAAIGSVQGDQAVALQVLRFVAPTELEHLRRLMIPWCCATMIASAQAPDGGIAAVGEGVMGHQ